MAYCTLDQLIAQYGEPLLREATDRGDVATGEIDAVAVARAIASADALIDGYLKVRYALPLVSTPALVTEWSMVIALYKLHPAVAAEKVRQDYQDTMKMLAQVSAGTLKLDVAGIEPTSSGSGEVRTNDPDRRLSADDLTSYI